MTLSARHLSEVLPAFIKDRTLQLRWEYSESLAWLIVTRGQQQVAITYRDGQFTCAPIESYREAGYISSFVTTATATDCVTAGRFYFRRGYKDFFVFMLRSAMRGEFVPMESMRTRMSALMRSIKRRKTRPQSMEIPPSLVSVVEMPKKELARITAKL